LRRRAAGLYYTTDTIAVLRVLRPHTPYAKKIRIVLKPT